MLNVTQILFICSSCVGIVTIVKHDGTCSILGFSEYILTSHKGAKVLAHFECFVKRYAPRCGYKR